MERTESIIVQVAPDYENQKVKEMEEFGWNLHGRQEIHEEGDAYGRPSYMNSNTYIVKTKVHQYVKLHFNRSLVLPNLGTVKRLESEYFNLPFPQKPKFLWPVIFTAIPIPALLMSLSDPTGRQGPGLPMAFFAAAWIVLGVFWIKSRAKKRRVAEQTLEASSQRAVEIRREVASALSSTLAQSASA